MLSKNKDQILASFAKDTFYNGLTYLGLTIDQLEQLDTTLETYGIYLFDKITLCTAVGDSHVNGSIVTNKGDIQLAVTRSDRLKTITVTMTPTKPIGKTTSLASFEITEAVPPEQPAP